MNSLQYNKINVSLNGTNILCDTVNVTEQSTQKPLFAINYAAPFDYTPDALKNSISLTYFMEVSNEPNYNIISGLKANNTTGNTQAVISLGNIIVTGYLSKLSFTVAPFQRSEEH